MFLKLGNREAVKVTRTKMANSKFSRVIRKKNENGIVTIHSRSRE